MRPRVADILLDLEFSEPSPLPVAAGLIEATTEGRVYVLEIPDDDPISALIAPPCELCGRACDGSCAHVERCDRCDELFAPDELRTVMETGDRLCDDCRADGWDDFTGIEGDD